MHVVNNFLAKLLVAGVTATAAIGQDGRPATLPAKVVVALKPDKNPDAMLAEKRVLESFLGKTLQRPVEVIIPLAAAAIIEGLANGTVDLSYLSASDMVRARDRGIADVLLAGEIDGQTSYLSYWVALREKPYASVADLRGRPVAFSSRTSTSGFVIPLWHLRQQGLIPEGSGPEAFFGRGHVWYGTGYVSAIERVLSGDAEAAAVSYYVLDGEQHLSPAQRARLKRIASQGPVPTHVIAVRAALGPEARDTLRQALTKLNEPVHQALRDRLFTSKLVTVDASAHLDPLRAALELAQTVR
ncbi:MAG: phosphate/phosphite/phosphonate ABC transporter substrate-binding protein [Verrucomicrobiales bacterium]|nr:phosphate/phosphite/phosphonate ABC transporter substrate-binding protein [Verrucomicrobiales bacterium]